MPDHKLRPGELTDEEVSATVADFIRGRNGAAYPAEWYRAIATAAYEKAMRRATEICREHLCGDYQGLIAAIEREAQRAP